MASPPRSEPVVPADEADPVAAVLDAHAHRRDLCLRTSGTTGSGTAVLRSTDSWWESFDAYSSLSGVGAGARVWVPGPLTATLNLFAAVHARAVGAVLADRPGEASHACLTPATLPRRGEALSRGCRVVAGGAALSSAQRDRAVAAGLRVEHYYGAAELSFVAWGPHAEELRAFPGVEVAVDEGRIRVRSPYLAHGVADADGWAGVGDLGRLDGDRLVVTGRPDAVTTAGATVLLAEVESALAPASRAPFAVLGVPHPTLGAVVGVVVTDPADRRRLGALARAALPSTHRPRVWRTLERLPLTGAGKVDRVALLAGFDRRDRREGARGAR